MVKLQEASEAFAASHGTGSADLLARKAVAQFHAAGRVRPEDAILRDEILISSEELLIDGASDVGQHDLPVHRRS